VKDYAKIAIPLNKLTGNVPWEWGPKEQKAFERIRDAIVSAPPLSTVNYNDEKGIVLAVDTSYMAVGYYLYQEDPNAPGKRNYIHFGSITLVDREARFSQPKRELFGLKLALEDSVFLTSGCRDLQVHTDASYIKGMLDNPGWGPNATINRWIEAIRRFQFELVHVKGKNHALADGLSRRPATPASQQKRKDPHFDEDDFDDEDDGAPLRFRMGDDEDDLPYEFEDFKHLIDTRGGYLQEEPGLADLEDDIQEVLDEERKIQQGRILLQQMAGIHILQNLVHPVVSPLLTEDWHEQHPYSEKHRTKEAVSADDLIPKIREYLQNGSEGSLSHLTKKRKLSFLKKVKHFFVDEGGRLYRKGSENNGQPLSYIPKDKRMHLLHSAHDHLGHKGVYATTAILEKRFWWPELEKDVEWFVSSCQACQDRQLRLPKMPPTLTYTPSLFQKIHVDVFKVSPASNGCKNVVHGRCALSRWSEGRALKHDNTRGIAEWFFEDIICRWGIPEEVVTDNAPQMRAVLKWLEEKYGVRGITISAYNSQANGVIERAHFDIRQALVKATGGDLSKWYWFLKPVLWADRVTPRKGLGCSPYFIVLGAEPILPFDIVESTWLVKLPDRILTTEELIGYRAQALAKHRVHVEDMIARVDETKRVELKRFEKKYRHVIKDWKFEPGTLVQVRNTRIEKSLDRKMYPRYIGPMIVIRRTKGGAYILAEMDGTVLREKVAAFRVLPHKARYEPIELPKNIHELIDLSPDDLRKMVQEDDESDESWQPGKDFVFDYMPNLRKPIYKNNEIIEHASSEELDLHIGDDDEDEEDLPRMTRAQKRQKATT
jgi:hypothetical protein